MMSFTNIQRHTNTNSHTVPTHTQTHNNFKHTNTNSHTVPTHTQTHNNFKHTHTHTHKLITHQSPSVGSDLHGNNSKHI